mgnify:CR=1 FL=1
MVINDEITNEIESSLDEQNIDTYLADVSGEAGVIARLDDALSSEAFRHTQE